MKKIGSVFCCLLLTACMLTPEQKAEREAKRLRAEQALQVKLAKQCDLETAELMFEQFNPPLTARSSEEERQFQQRYAEKVNHPLFQACYQLAWQHFQKQQALEELRIQYEFEDFRFRFGRMFCRECW